MDIKLGSEVKDATTGFTGIAIQKAEQLNGNIQYGIQPRCKDGETDRYPEAMFIDHHLLDVIGPGVSDRVTEVTAKIDFELGNKVEDIVTKIRGIATEKTTYMNGCVSFYVVGEAEQDKALEKANALCAWVQSVRLKKIDDGIKTKVEQPPKATNGKVPGGPARSVPMRSVPR